MIRVSRFLAKSWCASSNGSTPLGHLFIKEAYTKMMQVFVEGLRADGRTLTSSVHETCANQHFPHHLQPFIPVAGASGNIAPGADTGAIPDSNKESACEVDRHRRALRVQHSKKVAKLSKGDDQRYASSWSPHGPARATESLTYQSFE